LTKRSSLQTQD